MACHVSSILCSAFSTCTHQGTGTPSCQAPSALCTHSPFDAHHKRGGRAPALCQEPTSASFCARSTISVTASTQLCSSRERRAPRVKLLSMTKRFPVACRQGAEASLGLAGGCCAWPVLPQQQQGMHSSARLSGPPSGASPSGGRAWQGGAGPERAAAPAPWPLPSPPGASRRHSCAPAQWLWCRLLPGQQNKVVPWHPAGLCNHQLACEPAPQPF